MYKVKRLQLNAAGQQPEDDPDGAAARSQLLKSSVAYIQFFTVRVLQTLFLIFVPMCFTSVRNFNTALADIFEKRTVKKVIG